VQKAGMECKKWAKNGLNGIIKVQCCTVVAERIVRDCAVVRIRTIFAIKKSTRYVQCRQSEGVNPQTGVNGTFVVRRTTWWLARFSRMQRA
jgi:hypothetical protein